MKIFIQMTILFLSFSFFSCTTINYDEGTIENYRELKSDILKRTIDYFVVNNIVDTTEYFTLLTYPYYIDFTIQNIENFKLHINSFAPFSHKSLPPMDKRNSLMIVGLITENIDESIRSTLDVVNINNDGIVEFYLLFLNFSKEKWIVTREHVYKENNYYFFEDDRK
jgi:hypothetical protein